MEIRLKDMEFFAYHGVFEEEKANGNTFLVNAIIRTRDTAGCITDRIEDTLNYQAIYDIIKTEMGIRSDLLEHVATRMARHIKDRFPEVLVQIGISKKNPPLGGNVPWVEVCVEG